MIKDGFNILLLVVDTIQLFGERLKLSCIVSVPQAHLCPRLNRNLSAQPDPDTLSVNETTNREAASESLHFGRAFPRILQAVWEADPVQGPVWVSKLDVIDAYHRGTVKLEQVGAFSYIFPSAPGDEGTIICIDLVFPMGWVGSPKFFCTFSEMLTDVANALVNINLPVPSYVAISEIPVTGPGPLTTRRASPISIVIWMTSSQRCRVAQITNTESLMAQSVPSSGSYRHYWRISKTR